MSETQDDDSVEFTKLSRSRRSEELDKLLQLRGDKEGVRAIVAFAYRCALRALPKLGVKPLSFNWSRQPFWQMFTVVRANVATYQKLIDNIEDKMLSVVINSVVNATEKAEDALASSCASHAIRTAKPRSGAYLSYACAAYEAVTGEKDYVGADLAAQEDYFDLIDVNKSIEALLSKPLWGNQPPPSAIKLHLANIYAELKANQLHVIAADIAALMDSTFNRKQAIKYFVDMSESDIQSADDLHKLLTNTVSTVDNYAVRVLLLGPGGAGKTSLADLIKTGKTDSEKEPTVGIDYKDHQAVDLLMHRGKFKTKVKPLNPDIYLWDFGGQAIYHSLHHAFMHENCVYIVVVDSRHEQTPEPWLHQILHTAGPQAKVLVVTNWFDGIKTQQNRSGLVRKFPQLLDENSFFEFTCQTAHSSGFSRFINHLVIACSDTTKQVFIETKQAFTLLENTFRGKKNILFNQLKGALLKKFAHFNDDKINELMHKLKEFGRFIELGDASKADNEKYVCLDPNWTVNYAYNLVYMESVQQSGGFIGEREQDVRKQNVIDFMCQHGVCVKLINDGYFFPDAAPIDEPSMVSTLLNRAKVVTLSYELPYFPIGVKAKVATKLIDSGVIIDVRKYLWRDGFIAQRNNSFVIVEYQHRYNRIAAYLIGSLNNCAALVDTIDNQFITAMRVDKGASGECQVARAILGYPIFSSRLVLNDYTEKSLDVEADLEVYKKLNVLTQTKIFVMKACH